MLIIFAKSTFQGDIWTVIKGLIDLCRINDDLEAKSYSFFLVSYNKRSNFCRSKLLLY